MINSSEDHTEQLVTPAYCESIDLELKWKTRKTIHYGSKITEKIVISPDDVKLIEVTFRSDSTSVFAYGPRGNADLRAKSISVKLFNLLLVENGIIDGQGNQ